jgi:c-di-GMP-binding flagellar brake protein YcgR
MREASMSAWDGLNRRQFPRVNYPCLVTIRHDDKTQDAILTHTENIGSGGVCVILKKGLKMFAPVEIELDLLDLGHPIKCKGKVVWSVRRAGAEPKKPMFYDTGLEFVNMDDKEQVRIITIIERLAKQGKTTPWR